MKVRRKSNCLFLISLLCAERPVRPRHLPLHRAVRGPWVQPHLHRGVAEVRVGQPVHGRGHRLQGQGSQGRQNVLGG